MNGVQPPKELPMPHREAPHRVPISQALLQGTREISALFETRLSAFRVGYEAKIQELIQERDALLASQGDAINQAVAADALAALQGECEQWEQTRAQSECMRAEYATESAKWEEERKAILEERKRMEDERAQLQKEREEWRKERDAMQNEIQRVQSESDKKLRELVLSKDTTIATLEMRVKALESIRNGSPGPRPPSSPQQNQVDPMDVFRATPLSMTFADMSSTLGSATPTKSPSLDPAPMQVDVDGQPEPPTSPPMSPTTTLRGGRSPSMGRSSTLGTFPSVSNVSTMESTPRRLVIRVPPSVGKVRKPIKPPVSPGTEQERNTVAHVPPSRDSSDAGSPAKSSSGSTSTSESAAFSSP
ncbi:hypothetical protein C8Q79DRAFT_982657 [Trametes meyenii]|nr:hypothetical protein C8Q79DRAFT_982657 [Trametes meyenii]